MLLLLLAVILICVIKMCSKVTKQGLSGVVVDARSNNKLQFSPDELRDLFKLQEDTLCATHELLNCQCESGEIVTPQEEEESSQVVRACQLNISSKTTKKKVRHQQCVICAYDWGR